MRQQARTDNRAAAHCSAACVWHAQGWQNDVIIGVDVDGLLSERALSTQGDVTPQPLGQWVLPGTPNLHSHAFQRAMAGLAERRSRIDDSFWSWREIMYGFAAAISPEALQAIAAQLYVEMLKAGYTQVCEFHYLHHQTDGTPYAQPEAMSLALIEAAREAGIALTLLPVLYMSGGFDGRALAPRQCRFGNDVDSYLRLLESLRACENDQVRVGYGAAFAARRAGRCHSRSACQRGGAKLSHPHPRRRTDRRGAGLSRAARRAPGRVAAR